MAASTASAQSSGPVMDAKAHGASGDARINDAPAIQKAIGACAPAGGCRDFGLWSRRGDDFGLYSGRAAAYNRLMTRRFSRYYWFTCQVGG